MKFSLLQGMRAATRLTKSGRLVDATVLIKQLVSNTATLASGPATSADWKPARVTNRAEADHVKPNPLRRILQHPGLVEAEPTDRSFDGRFEDKVYSSASGERQYKLYTPTGHNGEALPLVIMLHGCTQSPDDFAAGTQMNGLADELGFFVAYPAQSRSANPSGCWNWFNAEDQKKGKGEPALIAGIAHQIMACHKIDARRVYVAGLSAGGAMAAILGMNYPEMFAAIGVHSGLPCGAAADMFSAFKVMKKGGGGPPRRSSDRTIPAIVFHGDGDRTVHPANGNELIAQLGGDGIVRPPVAATGKSDGGLQFTQSIHTDAKGKAISEQWLVHGAGHAWSGGSSRGSYTEPKGPDASREMIRFFLSHSLG